MTPHICETLFLSLVEPTNTASPSFPPFRARAITVRDNTAPSLSR
jgi:hypothetical protein